MPQILFSKCAYMHSKIQTNKKQAISKDRTKRKRKKSVKCKLLDRYKLNTIDIILFVFYICIFLLNACLRALLLVVSFPAFTFLPQQNHLTFFAAHNSLEIRFKDYFAVFFYKRKQREQKARISASWFVGGWP